MRSQEGNTLTTEQQAMSDLWDEHMRSEFESSSVEDTLETMVEEPYVNHVPVLTGGYNSFSLAVASLRSSRNASISRIRLAARSLLLFRMRRSGIFCRRLSACQIAVGISGTSSSVPTMASMREMPMAPR